jgi:rare lipoprotein A
MAVKPPGLNDMNASRSKLCRCLAVVLPLLCSLEAGADQLATRGPAKAAVEAHAKNTAGPDKPQARKDETSRREGSASSQRHARSAAAKGLQVKRQAAAGAAVKTSAAKGAAAKNVAAKGSTRKGNQPTAVATAATPSKARLDYSGRKRVGQASYYARRFAGRKMADGNPMRPNHHNAASKTLPLGTIAKVTNLNTGRSAVVKIQDRGPYVKGRIVDLSPATAREVGITAKDGVAPVEVTPIEVPMPDGSVKPGDAARDPIARTQVARAREQD